MSSEISLISYKLLVDENRITIQALKTFAKIAMGTKHRELSLSELLAFRVEESLLALEGPLGVTNVFLKKGEREALEPLIEAIRLKAPNAVEGAVSKKLQTSESEEKLETLKAKMESDRAEMKAAQIEAKEALAEVLPTKSSDSQVGDRTNFLLGTFGKKIASFDGVDLFEKAIRFKGKAWSISGAEVSLEMGAPKSRMTLTRIGTGALLFGGAGAIVGGMSKKNKQRGFLEIITDEGGFVIEFEAKQEKKARQFLSELKKAVR